MEKTNNILVEFNMLIDTDIGIFELMKNKYNNPNLVKPILNNIDLESLLIYLKNERYDNVIDIFIDSNLYDTEKLLKEFIEKEYDSIINNSIFTDIYRLMKAYLTTNMINVTVICNNDKEKKVINKLDERFSIIDKEDIDLKNYDTIFLKEYKNINFFKNVKAKNIFISDYANNKNEEDNLPLKDISLFIGKVNIIKFISLYSLNNKISG